MHGSYGNYSTVPMPLQDVNALGKCSYSYGFSENLAIIILKIAMKQTENFCPMNNLCMDRIS